jgi:dTMP kinase
VVSSQRAIRGALRSTPFRRLWYATALSSLGDWLGLLATTALAASLATSYEGRNYALGGVLLVRLLPSLVLGPLAGVFADRFDRRRTMVASDILRFGLFLSIPLLHSLSALYVATFLIECVSLFFNPAKDASVPNLVRRNQIEAANQLGLVTTYGLTPVAASLLFSLLAVIEDKLSTSGVLATQVSLALYFNAATFLVSAVIVWRIKQISGRRDERPENEPSLWALLREGLAFVRSSPLLRGLIIGIFGAFAAGGAVIGAGRTYVSSLGGGNAAYGVLFGAVFVGLGAGMALGPKVARDMSRRRLFGLAIVFAGACLSLEAFVPQVVIAMVVVLGVGFGAGVAYLSGMTLLGSEVDDVMRGRVLGFLQSLVRVVLILSLAAVPFLVGRIGQWRLHSLGPHIVIDGTRIVLLAAGLLALVSGLVAYRNMDDRQGAAVLPDLMSSLRGDSSARRKLYAGGLFIAFEGGEGAGKSMQVAALARALGAAPGAGTALDAGAAPDARSADPAARAVIVTHEPGATQAGKAIRRILLEADASVTPMAEALLFAADRAHHVATVIRPGLDAGSVVITDRYVDSSMAYQGAGRALSFDEVRRLSRFATNGLTPDLTVLLDIDPREGLRRVGERGAKDLLESESLEFHDRVRQAFRELAESEPGRYLVLDAGRPPGELSAAILSAVTAMLAGRRPRAVRKAVRAVARSAASSAPAPSSAPSVPAAPSAPSAPSAPNAPSAEASA